MSEPREGSETAAIDEAEVRRVVNESLRQSAKPLRDLVRVLVAKLPGDRCPVCGPYDRSKDRPPGAPKPRHSVEDCPWAAIVAEAEKP